MTITRARRPPRRNPATAVPGLELGPPERLTAAWIQQESLATNGVALFYSDPAALPLAVQVINTLAWALHPSGNVVTPAHKAGPGAARGAVMSAHGSVLLLDALDLYLPREILAMASQLRSPIPGSPPGKVTVVALSGARPPTAEALGVFVELATELALPVFFLDVAGDVYDVRRIPGQNRPRAGASASADASSDLAHINAHRRKLGMRPLDPAAAGWSADDVRLEAARLRREGNPRGELLAWNPASMSVAQYDELLATLDAGDEDEIADALEPLIHIGSGISRSAYLLPVEGRTPTVLKVAGPSDGYFQNDTEVWCTQRVASPLLPTVLRWGPPTGDVRWLEVEYLEPLTWDELSHMTGLSYHVLAQALEGPASAAEETLRKRMQQQLCPRAIAFLQAVLDLVTACDLSPRDFYKLDHWGLDAAGRLKLRDFGFRRMPARQRHPHSREVDQP